MVLNLTSAETTRLIKEGGGGDYILITTLLMTSTLRWAAMRAILMFHNCEGQKSQDHRPQLLKRKESQSGFEPRFLCLLA